MPRDDLSIDFVRKAMPTVEPLDPALILDDWTNRVANLPEEIKFIQEEITDKDRKVAECLRIIEDKDSKIQRWIRMNSSAEPNPREEGYRKVVREQYARADELAAEKLQLTQRLQSIMDKHLKYLDRQIKSLYDRNEPGFTNPDELPSLLRPSAANNTAPSARSVNPSANPITAALSPLANPPNPTGPKNGASQIRSIQTSQHVSISAPTSPAATMIMKRGARESSAGPGSVALPRAPRVNGVLGSAPNPSSGLARHQSLQPGTPKGHTATGVQRAGSAGPRTVLKGGIAPGRKGTPSGGISRSSKKGTPAGGPKSGLHRVRKSTKNSPSSTAESELSDADSGVSADEKYCVCQKVSFGDMIACDNESCPYEWFHWSCVGLKSEPQQGGTWYCPVCTEAMKKKGK
ncbi:Inhibitor of growth protein 3 [Cytospora mali]|uniref:Chromatin modification-related protein n=1 Tax=Cytospora mali TaxID=578113 RepID=A0A194VEF0_CYTMA|nr:Inhibitor of growth protein 3 [Valsa mali var. pyri (nom. inval.)]